LFFDYDGVLAPITADPVNSSVRADIAQLVRDLRREFKVTVVSGRDCPFLYRNLPGLDGYACVFGLEIHGGGYAVLDEEVYRGVKPRLLEELSAAARRLLGDSAGVIYGRTLSGVLVGVSIYWFVSRGKPALLEVLVKEAAARGLVIYDVAKWGDFAEYIDIHVARRSKRESIRVLKALLGVDRVVYFGDSYNDIPAFEEADARVFVKHEFNRGLEVDADYVVDAESLSAWIAKNAEALKE